MNSQDSIYTGFQFEEDGFPAFAIINKSLKDFKDRFSYHHGVFIGVMPLEYDEDGHPQGDEHDYLVQIEKDIIEGIEKEGETLHVGHTTLSMKREMIFYTKVPEKVEAFLQAFLPTINRDSNLDILEDPGWEEVEGFYELID
jgi:hypothetical protein